MDCAAGDALLVLVWLICSTSTNMIPVAPSHRVTYITAVQHSLLTPVCCFCCCRRLLRLFRVSAARSCFLPP